MSGHDKISSKNDLTRVEMCTEALYFDLDTYQIKLGFVQVNTESARKMYTVISCSELCLYLATYTLPILFLIVECTCIQLIYLKLSYVY